MVLHPLLVVDEHTPLPIHSGKARAHSTHRLYVTSFCSFIKVPFLLDLKHPFVAMSRFGAHNSDIHFSKWLNEGLLEWQKKSYTKRTSPALQMWFHFGIVTSKTRTRFYSLHTKINCLMTLMSFCIIYAKSQVLPHQCIQLITADCNFNN
ncbi:hypothetical protein H5410_001088 [Solanum commersonii]|uniref:Uncharacterized protein n=1 Tax=Solanum commersonii TaxID=4109 RepID=A0A9J6AYR7_SOLCO|nr:hypothetical protein H5410_001088 [Solanum commersonii]